MICVCLIMRKHFEQSKSSSAVHRVRSEWDYIRRTTNAERLDLDSKSCFRLWLHGQYLLWSFLLGWKDHFNSIEFNCQCQTFSLTSNNDSFVPLFTCCLTLLQELEALKSQVQSQSAEIDQMKTERQELLRRAEAGVNQTNVTFCAKYITALSTPAELINCLLVLLSLQM